jgi:NPCBM/NEW2 domain
LALTALSGVFGPLEGCKSEKAAAGRPAPGPAPEPVPTLAPTLKGGETKLGDIVVNSVTIGWGTPQLNRSVIGTPLSIGGQGYETGFGTCAVSRIEISFPAKYKTFTGSCGIDDVFKGRESAGSVVFWILDGEKVLFKSPLMRGRMKAVDFSVPVTGLTGLTLFVDDGGDGIISDHADWVNLNVK